MNIDYLEDIAAYPDVKSETKNYWQEEWRTGGSYAPDTWSFSWQYSTLRKKQGFDIHHTGDKLIFGIKKQLTPQSDLACDLRWDDLNYPAMEPEYLNEAEDPEDDDSIETGTPSSSRWQRKIGIRYLYRFSVVSVTNGLFFRERDFKDVDMADTNRLCWFGTVVYRAKTFDLSLKIAPWGDLSREDGYYELKLGYNY